MKAREKESLNANENNKKKISILLYNRFTHFIRFFFLCAISESFCFSVEYFIYFMFIFFAFFAVVVVLLLFFFPFLLLAFTPSTHKYSVTATTHSYQEKIENKMKMISVRVNVCDCGHFFPKEISDSIY